MADPVTSSDEAVEAAVAEIDEWRTLAAIPKALPGDVAGALADLFDYVRDPSEVEWVKLVEIVNSLAGGLVGFAAAVRAEAVADERRRIAEAIASHGARLKSDPAKLRGMTTVEHAVKVALSGGCDCNFRPVAAGSVSVATPEPETVVSAVDNPHGHVEWRVATPPAEPAQPAKAPPVDLLTALQRSVNRIRSEPGPSGPRSSVDRRPRCEHGIPNGHPISPAPRERYFGWCPGPAAASSQPATCDHGSDVSHWHRTPVAGVNEFCWGPGGKDGNHA